MNFVVYQMMKLHHVNHTNSNLVVKDFAGSTVVESGLSAFGQPRFLKIVNDLPF